MGLEVAITALVAGGAAAAGVITIGTAALLVASTALNSLLAPKPKNPGVGARNVTTRGTEDPQKLIYGEALVAGTVAFLDALGPKNRELWAVHVLSGHEVEDITDVWLDDRVITDSQINGGSSAGGAVTSGDFGPVRSVNVVEIYKHLGTSSQTVDTALQTAAGSGVWSNNHRLRGHAYIVTMFALWDKTETLWETGEPTNVRALVRGAKVYDPRLDSTRVIDSTTSPETTGSGSHRADDDTTWEWSDNPALCTADFLRREKFSPFPGGVAETRVDWESVAQAADDCEVLVFVPPVASPSNTQQRFTCNGVLFGTASPEQNLQALLSCFNGDLIFSNGKFIVRAGVYTAPVDSLDEDDIVGPISISSALDSEQRVNTIKAEYVDPERSYEPKQTVGISKSAYKDTRDGGDELIGTITLPMTNSWFGAQRIVLKQLDLANEELIIKVPCNLRAARLVPGERVNLTITERGWTPKVFKVLEWSFFDDGGEDIGVNVTLREDQSAAYADPAVSDYNTRTDAGALVVVDPEPIPGQDSIPRGIKYGEGVWNILVQANAPVTSPLGLGEGEVEFKAGTFVLPDGTVRSLSADGQVSTPYEGATTPPDGVFYIVWGATDPETVRFLTSPISDYGDDNAAGAGLFCAIYDRTRDQWYAVDNDGDETAFTPAAGDVVVARGIKTSASGGIDSITSLVTFVPEPIVIFRSDDFSKGITRVQSTWSEIADIGGEEVIVTGVTDAPMGGSRVWRLGDNSGDDEVARAVDRRLAMPVVAGEVYKVTFAWRQVSGFAVSPLVAQAFLGVCGWKGDVRNGGGSKVNRTGADSFAAQHYLAAFGDLAENTDWHTSIGYFQLGAGNGTGAAANDLDAPGDLHQDCEYVTPIFYFNSDDQAGIVDLAYVELSRVDGTRNVRIITQETDSLSGLVSGSPPNWPGTVSFTVNLAVARPIRIAVTASVGDAASSNQDAMWNAKLYTATESPRTERRNVQFMVADDPTTPLVKRDGTVTLVYDDDNAQVGNNVYELDISGDGSGADGMSGSSWWTASEDAEEG